MFLNDDAKSALQQFLCDLKDFEGAENNFVIKLQKHICRKTLLDMGLVSEISVERACFDLGMAVLCGDQSYFEGKFAIKFQDQYNDVLNEVFGMNDPSSYGAIGRAFNFRDFQKVLSASSAELGLPKFVVEEERGGRNYGAHAWISSQNDTLSVRVGMRGRNGPSTFMKIGATFFTNGEEIGRIDLFSILGFGGVPLCRKNCEATLAEMQEILRSTLELIKILKTALEKWHRGESDRSRESDA